MLELIFNAFVTLLVVVDPLGLAPLFVGLTRGRSEAYKREAAIRGTVVGAAILFLFAFVGQGLLGALGIGVPAFRIAGGPCSFCSRWTWSSLTLQGYGGAPCAKGKKRKRSKGRTSRSSRWRYP